MEDCNLALRIAVGYPRPCRLSGNGVQGRICVCRWVGKSSEEKDVLLMLTSTSDVYFKVSVYLLLLEEPEVRT